jgi:formate dehydrogenase accessory protein FdhD
VDFVAEEKPLRIFLGKTYYASIYCSPTNLKELAIGHLLSEGVVKSVAEIEEVSLKEEESYCKVRLKRDIDVEKRLKLLKSYSRVIYSTCGGRSPYPFVGKLPRVKSSLTVKTAVVLRCVNRLNADAKIFRKTGGVHAAAIFKSDEHLVALAEDVGRHNAVDKVIGMGAVGKIDFTECFLALSGRLTGDIALKAARVGLPIVASLAAAIDSGIVVARDTGLTLVGFVRGNRMNIYTFPERILLN